MALEYTTIPDVDEADIPDATALYEMQGWTFEDASQKLKPIAKDNRGNVINAVVFDLRFSRPIEEA
jgi:hypothetical protein